MGIFRQFPYTNFHDMNEDWIMSKITELFNEWVTYHGKWDIWQQNINQTVADFKRWIENLDLGDFVLSAIEKMIEEGGLAAYIEEVIRTQKGSQIALKPYKTLTHFGCRYRKHESRLSDYAMIQSFTSDDAAFYTCSYDSGRDDTEHVKVSKYSGDLDTVIAERIIDCYHGNDCTIFNNKLFITNSNFTLNQLETTHLNVEDVIDLSVINPNFDAIDISMLATINENEMLVGNVEKWYVLNNSFEIIRVIDVDRPANYPAANQSICYYDGSILMGNWPNTIIRYDLSGNIISTYNVGMITDDAIITEIESLTVFHDEVYVSASGWVGWPTETMINQFYIVNFKAGEYKYKPTTPFSYSLTSIYVDADYVNNDSDGSAQKPYKSLQHALMMLKGTYMDLHPLAIYLNSDIDEFINITGNKHITIYGQQHKINGINLFNCGNVFFNDLTIEANNDYDYSLFSNRIAVIDMCTACTLRAVNLYGLDTENLKAPNIQSSDVYMHDVYINDFPEMGTWLRSNITCGAVHTNVNPLALLTYATVVHNRQRATHFIKGSANAFVDFDTFYLGTQEVTGLLTMLTDRSDLANYSNYIFDVQIANAGATEFVVPGNITNICFGGIYHDGTEYRRFYFHLTRSNTAFTVVDVYNEGSNAIWIREIRGWH